MKQIIFIVATLMGVAHAQDKAFIRMQSPSKETNTVSTAKAFLVGATCKECTVTINDTAVKVYKTGSFGYIASLDTGENKFVIKAEGKGASVTKTLVFNFQRPKPDTVLKQNIVTAIKTIPAGNLLLSAGDKVQIKLKTVPGASVTSFANTPLYELPSARTGGVAGYYQGEYIIKPDDNFAAQNFPINVVTKDGQKINTKTPATIGVYSPMASDVAITKGRLAHLEFGLGDDRLGGAKIGYLDSNIALKVIGKVDGDYKIKLAENRSAYIPEELVELAPRGTQIAQALTGNWRVSGDSIYDYVSVALGARLPYQSMQLVNPSKIVVDVFGAVNNTNWITQLQSAKEVINADYEQVSDNIYRITLHLKHAQHWGHKIYYNGNNLVIRIKQQPRDLSLRNLTIAVDAGHGGSNTGAYGPSGSSEKALTLAMSQMLKNLLQKEGTKVLMTREREMTFDNKERILNYRDNEPDLLISIHLNSATDPFNSGGTSSFYRYIGFKPLSKFIHQRMLELGLKEYGNVGSFNFMLNSPTEYPNALVETLFLSNLEEEEKIVTTDFQQKIAEQILKGIKDFLQNAKDEK